MASSSWADVSAWTSWAWGSSSASSSKPSAKSSAPSAGPERPTSASTAGYSFERLTSATTNRIIVSLGEDDYPSGSSKKNDEVAGDMQPTAEAEKPREEAEAPAASTSRKSGSPSPSPKKASVAAPRAKSKSKPNDGAASAKPGSEPSSPLSPASPASPASASKKGQSKASTDTGSFETLASRQAVSTGNGSESFEMRATFDSLRSASSQNSTPVNSGDFTDGLAAARHKALASMSAKIGGSKTDNSFDAPCNACILYDWDDTLCPTFWCFSEAKAESLEERKQLVARSSQQLQQLSAALEEVLRMSRAVARVALITLADKDWFRESCELCFPGLDVPKLLQELGIKIYFAVKPAEDKDTEEMRVVSKQKVMAKCLSAFYSNFLTTKKVRKNVLSIGDSNTEHQALKRTLADYSKETPPPICKTLKFVDKPSLERLIGQLQALPENLERMMQEVKGFDRNSATLWIAKK